MGHGEGHCLLFRDKGERKTGLTKKASLCDMPGTEGKPECCLGRLSQSLPARHGAAHPAGRLAELRRRH